jgi:ACT domain-containing protein
MISEDVIRRITLEAIEQLGTQATSINVQRAVERAVSNLERAGGAASQAASAESGRVIITAYGVNHPGIIARVSDTLARHRCDILDMTQKLLQEFFTLIMIVDITNSPSQFAAVSEELARIGSELGIRVLVQHEDVFNAMHRL